MSSRARAVVLASLGLWCLPMQLLAQPDGWSCRSVVARSSTDAVWRGRYLNHEYRYRVVIPAKLAARSSPPPSPQHGFGIDLGAPAVGHLWVDGSWNSLEFRTPEAAVESFHNDLTSDGATILKSERESHSKDGVSGSRAHFTYRCPGETETFVYDYVVLLSEDNALIWTLALETPAARYGEDKKVFDAIVRSWKYIRPAGPARK